MKGSIAIMALLFLFSLLAKGQQPDTVFLHRFFCDTPYPIYHAIFIDTSRTSEYRNSVTDFSFDKCAIETYERELAELKPLKKTILPGDLPRRWVLLYLYKGEYFTYHPSEAGWAYKFAINDSTTIDYSMEGPVPASIRAIRKVSRNQFVINQAHPWLNKLVTITLVDAEKGIAVFEFCKEPEDDPHMKLLMVAAEKALQFRTIVNYCATGKQQEFDFDPIDFNALLKKHTK